MRYALGVAAAVVAGIAFNVGILVQKAAGASLMTGVVLLMGRLGQDEKNADKSPMRIHQANESAVD